MRIWSGSALWPFPARILAGGERQHGALLPERDAVGGAVSKILHVGRAGRAQIFLEIQRQSSHRGVGFRLRAGVRRKRGRESDGVERS